MTAASLPLGNPGPLAAPWLPLGRHLAELLGAPAAMVATQEDEDAALVVAARADPAAFRHLVDRYQGRVFATCLRMLGDAADAEDAAQEAFLRAYRALPRFEVGRRFGPWVCAIAANVARDHLRSPLRRLERLGMLFSRDRTPASAGSGAPGDLEARQGSPPDPVEQEDDRDLLAAALLTLKPRLREALVLRYVSDLSVEEVAEALNIGTSAAKMRLKRGLDELRAQLTPSSPAPAPPDDAPGRSPARGRRRPSGR